MHYAIQHLDENGKWETEDRWFYQSQAEAELAIYNHCRETGLPGLWYQVVALENLTEGVSL
jgi:hypothetical protein